MTLKFSQEDAQDMTRIIQRARPSWSPVGIMNALEAAAYHNTPGPTLTAALRAAHNKKADTPQSILWPEHWTPEPAKGAPNTLILCSECLTKFPANEMSKTQNRWMCNGCKEGS